MCILKGQIVLVFWDSTTTYEYNFNQYLYVLLQHLIFNYQLIFYEGVCTAELFITELHWGFAFIVVYILDSILNIGDKRKSNLIVMQ